MTDAPPPARAPSRARLGVILAAIVGLAVATGVIGWVGFRAVLTAVEIIGAKGLVFLVIYTAVPATLLGTAWLVLAPPSPARRWRVFFTARILRDAGGDVLPFTQLGGYVIGARAAVLQGISPAAAASTTIVDVTTELIGQFGFTVIGVLMLAAKFGGGSAHTTLIVETSTGLALAAVGLAGLVILQRKSSGLLERLARRFAPAFLAHVDDFGRALDDVYRRSTGVIASVVLHGIAWIASGAGIWFALRFAGVEIRLLDVLAIESLVGAVRSAGFVAPMAVGVQEAAYGFIGPIFGLPADMALAVSLIKRATSLTVGVPALALWQTIEGRRLAALGRRPSVESNEA
jgi:glycosyltransferase 2 family protein